MGKGDRRNSWKTKRHRRHRKKKERERRKKLAKLQGENKVIGG